MHRSIRVVLLAVVAVGCSKKDEPKPTSTPETKTPAPTAPAAKTVTSDTPAPATPATVKPAECAPGAWKNGAKDHPQFCLSLPKGFAVKGPEKKSHHEWRYEFTGPGDSRPELSITVEGIAKPGVKSGMAAHGPDNDAKVVVEDVPNGKRAVARPADYDKDEYAKESEYVVLSKGETVDVSKECGSCPAWDWIVRCYSSVAKQAATEDRGPCRTLRMP
jgi:hypothetical protein